MNPLKPNVHLLKLPHVVVDHILSYLTVPEQLKIRRLCHTTKEWIDRNQKRLAEHIPASVVQDRGQMSFGAFLNKRYPLLVSSLHLENDRLEMFETNIRLTEFLGLYAEAITSLRLKKYFICSANGKQIQFLEKLVNLKDLEIDEIWLANADDIPIQIPETFRNLVSFKLGKVKVYAEATYVELEQLWEVPLERRKNLRWQVWTLLDICQHLKYFRVPISPKFLFDNTFDECFRLLNYIRIRTRDAERNLRPQEFVMQCDLLNFACCTSSLEVLLIVGSRMRIQFFNVNSKVFKRGSSFCVVGIPPRSRFDYIHSLISSSLVNRTFEFVQKLTFKASLIQNECIIGREKGPALFPNLREFHIVLDIGFDAEWPYAVYSKNLANDHNGHQGGGQVIRNVCFPRADQVLKFFFPENATYNFTHTLSIGFEDPIFPNQKRATPERLMTLPVIIECLPHVKTLTIKGWNCQRKTYLDLWNGFPRLQKLIIDSCSTMNPSCLIGGNGSPNNPANFGFFRELEYVELKGLEVMPGMAYRRSKLQIDDVFFKFGFVPFKYLWKTNTETRMTTWIRPDPSSSQTLDHSTIVTRSVSKAMKI